MNTRTLHLKHTGRNGGRASLYTLLPAVPRIVGSKEKEEDAARGGHRAL